MQNLPVLNSSLYITVTFAPKMGIYIRMRSVMPVMQVLLSCVVCTASVDKHQLVNTSIFVSLTFSISGTEARGFGADPDY